MVGQGVPVWFETGKILYPTGDLQGQVQMQVYAQVKGYIKFIVHYEIKCEIIDAKVCRILQKCINFIKAFKCIKTLNKKYAKKDAKACNRMKSYDSMQQYAFFFFIFVKSIYTYSKVCIFTRCELNYAQSAKYAKLCQNIFFLFL